MKKTLSLILIALMMLTLLAGCGKSETEEQEPAAEDEITSDEVSGVVSLRSSLEAGEPRIWFETYGIDGRNTKIVAAYIFDEGKVATYAIGQKYMYEDTDALGYLEDYYALSPEESIDLIKEKYEAAHRAYYEELVDRVEPNIVNQAESAGRSAEEEPYKSAIEEVRNTYKTLQSVEFSDKPLEEYTINLHKDSSGNEVEAEELITKATCSESYEGRFDNIGAISTPYQVIKSETVDAAFTFDKFCEPFEVYDTFYGGFECEGGQGKLYLLTKCDGITEFVFDSSETAGDE